MRIPAIVVIFGWIGLVVFESGCTQSKGKKTTVPVSRYDSTKQVLLQIIQGGWVNEVYMDSLLARRSPIKAAATAPAVISMQFDTSQISGDTLKRAKGQLGNNPGGIFNVIFYRNKNGDAAMKIQQGNGKQDLQLGYAVEFSDTILLLRFDSVAVFRFHRQFRTVNPDKQITISPVDFFVNKILVEGKWKLNGGEISFLRDGHVHLYKNFSRYSILTSNDNAVSHPDEISFYNDSTGVTYAFTLIGRKLQLYEVKESRDGMKIDRGKMIGELERE